MDPYTIIVNILSWGLVVFILAMVVAFVGSVVWGVYVTISKQHLVKRDEWVRNEIAAQIIVDLIVLAKLEDSEHAFVGRALRFVKSMRVLGAMVTFPDSLRKHLYIAALDDED